LYDPRFRTSMSEEERQCLILKHLPQVRLVARRIHGRLPGNVSLDDLISAGIVGLISAVDCFDPSRRVELTVYAGYKIRGEILDSLRRLDWAPRRQRKHAKQIQSAIEAVQKRLHRAPTEQEIATELNITIDRYREWLVNVRGVNLRRLETAETVETVESDHSGENGPLRFLPGDPGELPSAMLERSELQRALAAAISGLPEIHQTVLSLHYRDELRLREISKIVGVHESRISQIKSQAIRRLRACMAKLWPTEGSRGCPHAQL
jgi:RNA polymerase sigma factor for flagellar operon FliA